MVTIIIVGTIYDVIVVQLEFTFTNKLPKGYTSLDDPPPYEQSQETLGSKSYDRMESTDIDKYSMTSHGYGTMPQPGTTEPVRRTGFNMTTTEPKNEEKREEAQTSSCIFVLSLIQWFGWLECIFKCKNDTQQNKPR